MQLAEEGRLPIRALTAGDGDLLERFFHTLSPTTVYRRFMSPLPRPTEEMRVRLLAVNHVSSEALAAFNAGQIVGVARYARDPRGEHDLAVVVADAWQRQGVSRTLLTELAQIALRRGIGSFQGLLLAENRPAIEMLRNIFPGVSFRHGGTEVEAEIPLLAAAR